MTESDWLSSADSARMLRWLRGTAVIEDPPGRRVSDRKLRLFACACCRHSEVWDRLTDDAPCGRCRGFGYTKGGPQGPWEQLDCPDCGGTGRVNRSCRAVEAAEAFADGGPIDPGVGTGAHQARMATRPAPPEHDERWTAAWMASMLLMEGRETLTASEFAEHCYDLIPLAVQAALLRDICGNPFRPRYAWTRFSKGETDSLRNGNVILLPEDWLLWHDGTVRRIAEGVYEERAFDRLPILHDALLDAGADDEDLLEHCRSGGPHARGCWVLDLILGKG